MFPRAGWSERLRNLAPRSGEVRRDVPQPGPPNDEEAPTAHSDAVDTDLAVVVEKGEEVPEGFDLRLDPLNRHSAFYVGFVGAIGVLTAWTLVQVLGQLSQVLLFLVVAIFLALGLNPLVEWLMRHRLTRRWAVFVVFLGLTAAFVLVGSLVLAPVISQARTLIDNGPDILSHLRQDRVFRHLENKYHFIERGQLELKTKLTSGAVIGQIFGGILGAGKAILDSIIGALTVLVLTLYFLAALPQVKAAAYRLVPLSKRTGFVQISEEISRRVGSYVVGQLVVATINGLSCFAMLELLQIPYAGVIAVVTAFLALVPIVGTLIGGVLVVGVALSLSWPKAVIAFIYYVVYHVLESYVVGPRIMRQAVNVPPAVTVVAILAGGSLLGVVGALIAIPVAAGLLLIYEEVVVPRQQQS
ncbi:MAG: rane protein [Marmoricola sp.]|nr:rane protein [Marmoricola sp.]